MALITPEDIAPFATIEQAKLAAMIADATAMAILAAPCLADEQALTAEQLAQAKALIRSAILRWNDAGTGSVQQETAGPFSVSFSQQARKSLFAPDEVKRLQGICRDTSTGGAFSIDTAPQTATIHADICNLNLGASWCSCGADIAGHPIYEASH